MAEVITIARPYARAAFEFAQSAGALSAWSDALSWLAALMSDSAFRAYVLRPNLTAQQQADALLSVDPARCDASVRQFVQTVAKQKRLTALSAIAAQFEALRAQAEGEVTVEVTTAYALSSDQIEQLSALLKKQLSREVNLTSQEDTSLIGGVVIRAGDTVIDASVRGQLGKLHSALTI